VVGDRASFPTLDHARGIASAVGPRATAIDVLRWRQAKEKAHQGGSRNPDAHFDSLEIVTSPKGAVILFDDVKTSGSQLIGACRRLRHAGIDPACAVVVGRTTHEQHEKMLGWELEQLDTEPARIDLSAILDRPLSDW
jgi:predicted amidophosphoribosyltransferase